MSRMAMGKEPTKQAALKFIVRDGPRHGVAGMRHQPEFRMARRSGGNQLRMPRSDIPVGFAMDQQHGHSGVRHRFQRTGLEQIDPVTNVGIHNC